MSSTCALCDEPNEFKDGGYTCMRPFSDSTGSVCIECTRGLTIAWAVEFKRKNLPFFSPDPTSPPAGSGTAYVEQLQAVS